MKQSGETALHQAHDVCSTLTGRQGDGETGGFAFSLCPPVPVSPRPYRGVAVQLNEQTRVCRKQHVESRALRQLRERLVRRRFRRIAMNFSSAQRADGYTNAGEQQSQVIVNFSLCTNG